MLWRYAVIRVCHYNKHGEAPRSKFHINALMEEKHEENHYICTLGGTALHGADGLQYCDIHSLRTRNHPDYGDLP